MVSDEPLRAVATELTTSEAAIYTAGNSPVKVVKVIFAEKSGSARTVRLGWYDGTNTRYQAYDVALVANSILEIETVGIRLVSGHELRAKASANSAVDVTAIIREYPSKSR